MANNIRIVTPLGTLIGVNIMDSGKLNLNSNRWEYTASIVLKADESKPIKDAINAVLHSAPDGQGQVESNYMYYTCDEKGIHNPSGAFYRFNFRSNVYQGGGVGKTIGVFNSNADTADLRDLRIGNGTTGAISGSIDLSDVRKVSLLLNAVQVIALVQYRADAGFESYDTTNTDFYSCTGHKGVGGYYRDDSVYATD